MDEKIQKILEEKIHESISKKNEFTFLAESLVQVKNVDVFGY